MSDEGRSYKGVLYAGLMLTQDGPKVLEFNVRFGDPETETLVPRMECDLAEVLAAAVHGRLEDARVEWKKEATVCVILASSGYPNEAESGKEISGLPEAAAMENVVVFHAGTSQVDGKLLTAGGRVLAVTACHPHLTGACDLAYQAISKIRFEGMQFRKDIARKAFKTKS